MSDFVWISSFDIGKKNFSFYIEEVDLSMFETLEFVPLNKRYNDDSSPTEAFEKVLEVVYGSGKCIQHVNLDLTNGCAAGKYLDPKTFYNMNDVLDMYHEYWTGTDIFIIEKQMSFGKINNTMAVKVGQHCFSYFTIKYPDKKVVEFPAYHKTQILGAKKIKSETKTGKIKWKAIDKPARKKWTIAKSKIILANRDDFETLATMTTAKKSDDLADTLCQCQAAKVLLYIDNVEL
jgi:hypothetical protein